MGWPVSLPGPGLGPGRAKARARTWSAPGPGWAGPRGAKIFLKLPMYAGWRGGAKPPPLTSIGRWQDCWKLRSQIIGSAYRGPYIGQC